MENAGRGLFRVRDSAPFPWMTRKSRADRGADELIGICRGILSDGAINPLEAQFLMDWLERHRDLRGTFPYSAVYQRVDSALADGVIDSDDERDLLATLSDLVGGEASDPNGSRSLTSRLPFDDPEPDIAIAGRIYVLTGKFACSSRSTLARYITNCGGAVRDNVSKSISYLLVGAIGSRDWAHSSFGRKIEMAVKFRDEGANLAIVSEAHWTDCCAKMD